MTVRTNPKDSWVETSAFPGSRYQPIISIVLLVVSLLAFLLLSSLNDLFEVTFFFFFATLTFIIVAFPQHREFKDMGKELETRGVAKAKSRSGVQRFIPLFTFFSILFVLPMLMLFLAPPLLFFVSVMGIITGFASFQLFFVYYVEWWEKLHSLKVKRYNLLYYDDRDKRVILEYGLRAERS